MCVQYTNIYATRRIYRNKAFIYIICLTGRRKKLRHFFLYSAFVVAVAVLAVTATFVVVVVALALSARILTACDGF